GDPLVLFVAVDEHLDAGLLVEDSPGVAQLVLNVANLAEREGPLGSAARASVAGPAERAARLVAGGVLEREGAAVKREAEDNLGRIDAGIEHEVDGGSDVGHVGVRVDDGGVVPDTV